MQRWVLILALVGIAFFGYRWKTQNDSRLAQVSPLTQLGDFPHSDSIDATLIQRQVVHDGEVDERALGQISGSGDSVRAAVANYVAARFEYEHQRPESSLRHILQAEQFAPKQSGIRLLHAILLLESNHYPDAISQSEEAVRLDLRSAEAQRILGQAYYDDQQLPRAIEAWQRSLQLRSNDKLQQQLEKAQREIKVESNFFESHEGRFLLRYEGGTLTDDFKQELLRTLESQYQSIAQDLGDPSGSIAVTVYTRPQFLEITRAPEWAGALNDGQLRIPLDATNSITPHMQAILRHELTHWFVHQIAHNCPVWLNEGVAQLEEPRTASSLSPQLRKRLQSATLPTLPELEKPFMELPAEQAQVAYAESLIAAEYLRANYGIEGIRRILEGLGEGRSLDDALNSATGFGYSQLQLNFDGSLQAQRTGTTQP